VVKGQTVATMLTPASSHKVQQKASRQSSVHHMVGVGVTGAVAELLLQLSSGQILHRQLQAGCRECPELCRHTAHLECFPLAVKQELDGYVLVNLLLEFLPSILDGRRFSESVT
jgi:hypothetical protein